jgi:hypothetical protein
MPSPKHRFSAPLPLISTFAANARASGIPTFGKTRFASEQNIVSALRNYRLFSFAPLRLCVRLFFAKHKSHAKAQRRKEEL